MIKIGITGSIASGKTTVANMLSKRKYPLFNADKAVRQIYKNNIFKNKVYKKFKLRNKKNIKNEIKKIISTNKRSLKDLEKIIHPLVRKEIRNFSQKNKRKKLLIFEIPLLIESKLMKNYNKIIFVNSKKKIDKRKRKGQKDAEQKQRIRNYKKKQQENNKKKKPRKY